MTPKDPNTVFVIELVGGIVGLLGLGYMYVGRTNEGLVRLLAWLAFNVVAWSTITVLSFVLIGLCLIPVQLVVQVGIPIWSALALKKQLPALPIAVDAGAAPQIGLTPQDQSDYGSTPSYRPPGN